MFRDLSFVVKNGIAYASIEHAMRSATGTNLALAELHEERDRIDEAILMFSRLAAGAPKRPGRPPKWLAESKPRHRGRPPKSTAASAVPQTKPRRQRKGMSKDARKAQSEHMKEFWAAKRKAKA